jgi:hypothetical protein
VAVFCQRARKIPRGFGLRQPSAAFPPQGWRRKSGRGLPQSKTLTRKFNNPIRLVGYTIFVTVIIIPSPKLKF